MKFGGLAMEGAELNCELVNSEIMLIRKQCILLAVWGEGQHHGPCTLELKLGSGDGDGGEGGGSNGTAK